MRLLDRNRVREQGGVGRGTHKGLEVVVPSERGLPCALVGPAKERGEAGKLCCEKQTSLGYNLHKHWDCFFFFFPAPAPFARCLRCPQACCTFLCIVYVRAHVGSVFTCVWLSFSWDSNESLLMVCNAAKSQPLYSHTLGCLEAQSPAVKSQKIKKKKPLRAFLFRLVHCS